VTGASGFIGWHVVRALARAGRPVRVLVRPASDVGHLRDLGVEIFVGDVLQLDSLLEPSRGVSAVVHLAGVLQAGSEEAHRRVHVDGTMNLLDALARQGGALRRFVFVSSLAAAGPTRAREPLDETAVPRPVGAYGRTKLEAEAAVLERKDRLPITIFRPPLVYGPRDRSLLPYFRAVRAGLMVLPGGGEQLMSLIHAADLAAAIVRAIDRDHPSGLIFNVADGPARRLRDLAEAIRLAQGTPAFPLTVSRSTLGTTRKLGRFLLRWFPAMPGWIHPDSMDLLLAPGWNCADALLRRTLDWSPAVTLVEGLAGTVQWYRDAGWLLRPWGGPLNRRELRPSKAPPE
jgi:dihydroflavonol-4-reductase